MKRIYTLEDVISYALLIGVVSGLALCLGGVALYFYENRYSLEIIFDREWILSLDRLILEIGYINAYTISSIGIVIMIFTPYLRVLISLIYFAKIRDYRYILTTMIVLVLLTFSLLAYGRT
ncbi:MAG: DUF1634 domain-containing protein [Candidatus Caldarchaeales archaeon]